MTVSLNEVNKCERQVWAEDVPHLCTLRRTLHRCALHSGTVLREVKYASAQLSR